MSQDIYIYDPNIHVPENVRHVEIPKGVTFIGEDAFKYCSDLQSVTIPDSVNQIFHLKLTTYTCTNNPAYPYPLPENIGHIGKGSSNPQMPE